MDTPRPPEEVSLKVEMLQDPPNPHFASRNWELRFLDAWLSLSESRSCVVGGLPGVGKTQLVNEYVHKFCDGYDCIVWLPAGNTDSMMSRIKKFCNKVGIASEASDLETCAKAFKTWQSTSKNWLLVFDDVVDWTAIEEYLPTTHGSSLITTRNLKFLTSGTHNLQLDSLDATLGAELFCGYLKWQDEPSQDDQQLARAVSEELGGSPMALAHVAGYITKHDLALETMVQRLRHVRCCDHIWREEYILTTTPHPASLGELWNGLLAELRPEGRAILELMAFFNADQVPQYFWNSRIEDEPQRAVFSKALEDLQERGLVHRKRIDDIVHLSIHRALQKTMLYRLRWGTRLYSCVLENAIAMVHSACPQCEPFGVPKQDDWLKYDRVAIQAESLRTRVSDDRLPCVVALKLCGVYAEVCRNLHLRGDHGTAQPLVENGLRMCEALPKSRAASVHATLLLLSVENKSALGVPKRASAFDACNRAFQLRKEFPTTDDTKINDLWLSDAVRDLGRAFLETSDWSSAETQLVETFILLNNHTAPFLLPYGFAATYEALSLLRMSQQRSTEALELIDKAIATAGMVQKPNAAVFLQLTFNRAIILFNQGDFKEAWKVAKANLRSGEALWGKESSSALSSLFWAARALYRQKLFREAERNLRDLLRKSTKNQHWPAECVARARYLLAETLQALGEELEEALELKKEAAETIGEDAESVTMADFDVRISIYYGRAIGDEDDDGN
ncbi:hypothetical protein PG993_000359 [Apiospora rasikravindrae]|uniref:NB-ARC domain-containing protein n=1 Tax=Apiospora rasikravindrae TaxID=990691 RepID=A0ABR1U8U7_9PEZI